MSPPDPVPLVADLRRARAKIDTELRIFVRADIDDEIARLRRRFHIHSCMIGCVAVLTFLSVFSVIDAATLVGSSVVLNGFQEWLDYIGRF